MLPNRILAGCGALSLSLSLMVGCASPTAPETTPVTTAEAQQPVAPVAQPEAPAPTSGPAAAVPTPLSGLVTFKGQPVAGYAITVYDARTNMPVERKADLAGATGLAVLDKGLTTDAQGGFTLQVVGLEAGQALRVIATKGQTSLEAIVTSDMRTLGAKQRRVLAADANLTLSELTTAMAMIARNVVRTTQVLSPQAAAQVLAKMMADLDSLSSKLEAQLKQLPSLADELTRAESPEAIGKDEAAALKVLINNAGVLQEATKTVADLVFEIAKQSQDPANRSAAAADPKVAEALAKIEYLGTVLTGSLDQTGTINLLNGVTGGKVDASTGIGTIADRVTPNRRSDRQVVSNIAYVETEQELSDAVADSSKSTIILTAPILLNGNIGYTINRQVTIDGGDSKFAINGVMPFGFSLNIGSGVKLQNLHVNLPVVVTNGDAVFGATIKDVTFSNLMLPSTAITVHAGNKATIEGCSFTGLFIQGINAQGAIEVDDIDFTPTCIFGIFVDPATAPAPKITNCTFSGPYGIDLGITNITAPYVGQITGNTFTPMGGLSWGISLFANLSADFDAIEQALETTNDGLSTYSPGIGVYWKNN